MEMTVNIDDSVAQRLREEACRRETTESALVEAGLHRVLPATGAQSAKSDGLRPLPRWNSGGHLVNIDNREELYRAMGGDEIYGGIDEA